MTLIPDPRSGAAPFIPTPVPGYIASTSGHSQLAIGHTGDRELTICVQAQACDRTAQYPTIEARIC